MKLCLYVNKMPKRKVGSVVTFKNGAKAKVLPSGRLRIFSGPTSGPGSKRKGKKKKGGGLRTGGGVSSGGGLKTYG